MRARIAGRTTSCEHVTLISVFFALPQLFGYARTNNNQQERCKQYLRSTPQFQTTKVLFIEPNKTCAGKFRNPRLRRLLEWKEPTDPLILGSQHGKKKTHRCIPPVSISEAGEKPYIFLSISAVNAGIDRRGDALEPWRNLLVSSPTLATSGAAQEQDDYLFSTGWKLDRNNREGGGVVQETGRSRVNRGSRLRFGGDDADHHLVG